MNSVFASIVGVIICTGPLWGAVIGYNIARRGWRMRSPFHHDTEEDA